VTSPRSASSIPPTDIAALSPDIRYVATYDGSGEPLLWSRADLANASSSDSDRYEELLVNPALLTLARQRGNIDCGGLRYLIVRYGNFFQLVVPTPDGHVSVALEPQADLPQRTREILALLSPAAS
jgi:hypothetical protein